MAPCFCPHARRGWFSSLHRKRKLAEVLVQTFFFFVFFFSSVISEKHTIQQVLYFVQIHFKIWNLGERGKKKTTTIKWTKCTSSFLTTNSARHLRIHLYDILWCEIPGPGPWNKCSWRYRRQFWGSLPSCLCLLVSPVSRQKVQERENIYIFTHYVQYLVITKEQQQQWLICYFTSIVCVLPEDVWP